MSDKIYLYFQDELKESGKQLGIENLTIPIDSVILKDTIIDSVTLKDKKLNSTQSVMEFISEIKTEPALQERRGVAVIGDSIKFDPEVLNEQSDYLILANGPKISVAVTIENQGNVVENDVNVVMIYRTEDNIFEEKKYTINSINLSEKKIVRISGFTAYPGRRCTLEITAVPVPGEVRTDNNTVKYKFMMEED